MSLKRTRSITLTLFVLPLLFSAYALASDISSAIKLCNANSSCSHGEPDAEGGILFKIKFNGSVARLYCALDGECARLYPRGLRVASTDPTSVMALTKVLAPK